MPSKTYCSQCGTPNLYELGKKPAFCNGCGQPFNVGVGEASKTPKLKAIQLEEEDDFDEEDEGGESGEFEGMSLAVEIEPIERLELTLHDLLENKEGRITNAPVKRKELDPHMMADALERAKQKKTSPVKRGRAKRS